MDEFWRALQRRASREGGAPAVTWYGADGQRAELSATSLLTAVAKTAAVLVDEWEVPAGARVRLDLPLHWQLPVWLAACDLAGMTVTDSAAADVVVGMTPDPPGDAEFPVLVAGGAFGLPGPPPPAPLLDHARDAMGQPDAFLGVPAPDSAWDLGARRWDRPDIAGAARSLAADLGLHPGGRLLVPTGIGAPTLWLAVWATPLLVGAAAVLCETSDTAAVAAAEHVTARVEP